MRPTITDVARLAGVSTKTVSRVVNEEASVRPTTRTRVLEAVAELGYRPDRSARALRTGRTDTIGLVVPELDQPFFATLADAVATRARHHGLAVVAGVTGARADAELGFPAGHPGLDGVILYWQAAPADAVRDLAAGTPLVLLGETGHPHVDHVMMDNRSGIEMVVAHLAAIGRTHLAVLGTPPPRGRTHSASRRRTAAFLAAAARHRLDVDDAHMVSSVGWRRPDGARATRELLNRGVEVDAVVALNDGLALGCVSALAEAGLRVPDDVAVTGFDNLEETQFSLPSITTVGARLEAYAASAVDLLLARVAEPGAPVASVTSSVTLVVRESTIGGGPAWRAA